MTTPSRRACRIALLVVVTSVWLSGESRAQDRPPAPRHVAAQTAVGETTLVKASDGIAVIRVAARELEKVRTGDLVGTSKAVVMEIAAGRLVLEETYTGADGRPNKALIIFKDGESGGTRYLPRPEEPRPIGSKPVPVGPIAPPVPRAPKRQPDGPAQ